ncbi:MAG: rhomboid family intramembrane serine protease [Chloroflexi bacterium]|nr:rhomboid family intramembrane serine protease [Chloroflexota bacterium]
MLPFNDTEPNRYSGMPWMTISLIMVNTVILTWELYLPEVALNGVFWVFGSNPSHLWAREGAGIISVITCMFLHAGIGHLLFNMISLWVFGRRVEDACGAWRYLLYYLLSGTLASLITALAMPHMDVPTIGASGAIFGVMGAYFVLFPGGRIRTLWFFGIIKIRAFWIVLYYLLVQIPPAYESYMRGADYDVAYWAHLGGFFACIFIPLFLRPEAFARYMSDVPV